MGSVRFWGRSGGPTCGPDVGGGEPPRLPHGGDVHPTQTLPIEGRAFRIDAMNDVTTRTRRPRPAAVALTPGAEARVAELMARAPEGTIGVKLSTPRRGCSG